MRLDERFGFPRESAGEARAAIGLAPGMRVLEVGCGTGAFARFLLPTLGGRGEYVGLDLDEDHLAVARKEIDGNGVAVRFERGDAASLPFPSGRFDAVVSQFLLCILRDPYVALKEMARVVRPGGIVASVSCFCKSGGLPAFNGGDWPGKARWLELDERFRRIWRTTVRNPGLGLPNGRDLDVWADYARAGIVDREIRGFLPCYAPQDRRWTPDDAREYVERRRRIDGGVLDRLTESQLATLAANGLGRGEIADLRRLHEARFAAILADPKACEDVLADPAVLIVGRTAEEA